MKVILENTTTVMVLNGIPGHLWEGCTETGIPIYAFTTRVAPLHADDQAQFVAELRECRPPSPGVREHLLSVGPK